MIVVTGAAGLLGANLVRALVARGENVRCLVHQDHRALEGLDVEIMQADVLDAKQLDSTFEGVDLVYHLAAVISLDRYAWPEVGPVNVQGTRNVVEACLSQKVRRLVHFSTIHALEQFPNDQVVDENRPRVTSPLASAYDRSKALGELEVERGLQAGLEAVILNPTGVIGPYDYKPSFFGEALLMIAKGIFPVLVTGGFNWVDARDVAELAIGAANFSPNGQRYLVPGEWRSVKEIAQVVSSLMGTQAPWFYAPHWLAALGVPLSGLYSKLSGQRQLFTDATLEALSSFRYVSGAKAHHDFGYSPRPFRETIRDTLIWFINHGYLTRDHSLFETGERAGNGRA